MSEVRWRTLSVIGWTLFVVLVVQVLIYLMPPFFAPRFFTAVEVESISQNGRILRIEGNFIKRNTPGYSVAPAGAVAIAKMPGGNEYLSLRSLRDLDHQSVNRLPGLQDFTFLIDGENLPIAGLEVWITYISDDGGRFSRRFLAVDVTQWGITCACDTESNR